jgi:hypothetical protein
LHFAAFAAAMTNSGSAPPTPYRLITLSMNL